jgi:hypothetical protein
MGYLEKKIMLVERGIFQNKKHNKWPLFQPKLSKLFLFWAHILFLMKWADL